MGEVPLLPQDPRIDSRKWIGRIVLAVLMGEAIWGFIVSICNNLLQPLMARVLAVDAQSPFYLGKEDFNIPALFLAVLELCLAGIVAILVHSWSQRKPKLVRRKQSKVTSVATPVSVSAQSAAISPAKPAANPSPTAVIQTAPPAAPQAAKPASPQPAKPVFYNIAGQPVDADDE